MIGKGWKPHLAELVGTYLLVLFAAGAVVVTARIDGTPNAIVCGLSSGLILAVVISIFISVSGAHVNPALTIALAYLARFPWRSVPGYVLAQLVGSAAGGLTVLWAIGDFASVGANIPNAALGVSGGGALALEIVLSFIMMMVILLCGDSEEIVIHAGAIRIGAIVGIEVLLFGPIAGAAMNPARAFGPYLAMGDWSNFWIYALGPVTGCVAAAAVYRRAAVWASERVQAQSK
ncbi:MAG TPA: aquaporin [Dongiaceae bacterium]